MNKCYNSRLFQILSGKHVVVVVVGIKLHVHLKIEVIHKNRLPTRAGNYTHHL